MNTNKIQNEAFPMLEVTPTGLRTVPTEARHFPGPRTIRRVVCAAGAHSAGLILGEGHHLVWREHLIHSAAGSTWPCSASGRDLCDAPAPEVAGVHTPNCSDVAHGTPACGWSW